MTAAIEQEDGSWLVGDRRIELPCEVRHARIAFANFLVPVSAAHRALDGTGLTPLQPLPRHAVVALTVVDYLDGDFGVYGEAGVAWMVHRHDALADGDGALARLRSLLAGEIGVFMEHVPVTETFPMDAGIGIWGLPKRPCETTLSARPDRVIGHFYEEGRLAFGLEVPRVRAPIAQIPEGRFATYTLREGVLRCFEGAMGGAGLSIRPLQGTVTLGSGHVAEALAAAGLPRRPISAGYLERSTAWFGPPQVL